MSAYALSAYHYFHAALYYRGSQCGRRLHIQELLEPELANFSFSLNGLENAYSVLVKKWKKRSLADELAAQQQIALIELADSVSFFRERADVATKVAEFSATHDYLSRLADDVEQYYASIGLPGARAEVFLVDNLPAPYADRPFAVLAADQGDYEKHGIIPGLYFLKKLIKPVSVNYLMAHEAVHAYLGKVSPYETCDYFEEGLADLLSVFGCIRELMGDQVAKNVYLLSRLNSANIPLWESYIDGSKKALAKMLGLGLSEMIKLVTKGREGLRVLRDRNVDNLMAAPLGEFEKTAISLLLEFPRNHVVSAQAYLLSQHLEKDITVAEAASRVNMSNELTLDALKELDGRAMVTYSQSSSTINSALCRQYFDERLLRYDFRVGG